MKGKIIALAASTAFGALALAMPATAERPTLEACLETPAIACVDTAVDWLLADYARIADQEYRESRISDLVTGLIFSRYIDRAESIADAMRPGSRRDSALSAIAMQHAGSGKLAEARRVLAKLTERAFLETALVALALGEARAGEHDRALATAASITDTGTRDAAYGQILDHLFRSRQTERARALMAEIVPNGRQVGLLGFMAAQFPDQVSQEDVRAAIDIIEDPFARAEARGRYAKALAMTGSPEAALGYFDAVDAEMAALPDDPDARRRLLEILVSQYTEAMLFERAAAVIERIDSAESRVNLLTFLAQVVGRSGDEAEADRLYARSLEVAAEVEDTALRSKHLGLIAVRWFAIDDAEDVLTIARSIPDPKRRAEALEVIGVKLVGAGRLEQGEAVLREIEIAPIRLGGLMGLAHWHAREGAEAEALDLVAEVEETAFAETEIPRLVDHALRSAAATAGRLEAFERAHDLTARMRREENRIIAVMELAQEAERAGARGLSRDYMEEAIRRVNALAERDDQTHLLSRLYYQVAVLGDADDVAALAELLDAPDLRQQFLTDAALAFINAGDAKTGHALIERHGDRVAEARMREAEVQGLLLTAINMAYRAEAGQQ